MCITLDPKKSKKISKRDLLIDPIIFLNEQLSPFEAIVLYYKDEKHLRFREIGQILGRDERNIWTVYTRATKKNVKK